MVDDRNEIGVDDGVRKLGSDVEEVGGGVDKEKFVSVVKSDLEELESGVDSEKVKEKSEGNEVGNGFADYGKKDSENTQGVKEVGSDDVEVNVDDNVEVGVKGGGQSDEVPELKGVDVEEVVKEKGLSDAGEDNKKMAPNGREEVGHEEVNATGEFQRLNKPVVQEGADTQDEEVQIDEVPTVVAEHSAVEKIQHLEEPVWHEGTGTHDAEVRTDDAATGITEHNSIENMENVPLDLTSPVKDNADHTDNLELPVPSECQAEAVLTEGTVNGVLGAADTLGKSNAITENYGDKLDVLSEVDFDTDVQPENGMSQMEWTLSNEQVDDSKSNHFITPENKNQHVKMEDPKADEEKLNSSLYLEGDESGTEDERIAFFREVETFFKARGTDFRAPKFYGEPLNLLKLWRAVIRLGGYEQVTSCKLWRQIGESFNPPKTCTTVSWTFRLFYEKALLEFERHKMRDGDLPYDNSFTEFDTETQNGVQTGGSQGLGSGRVMRDSAARAMQGWHSQRSLSNGEIGDPTIMDKSLSSTLKREKHTKSHDFASLKRKTTYPIEQPSKVARSKPHMEISVIDAGEAADWVKINIRKTKDCFEIYALVPGLTREEVRVQSDPAGRLVISGEPQQLDNPWGVTPFKKVVSLPSRIDPHQTSAVVTLHGQLFVRVPFKQLDGQ